LITSSSTLGFTSSIASLINCFNSDFFILFLF